MTSTPINDLGMMISKAGQRTGKNQSGGQDSSFADLFSSQVTNSSQMDNTANLTKTKMSPKDEEEMHTEENQDVQKSSDKAEGKTLKENENPTVDDSTSDDDTIDDITIDDAELSDEVPEEVIEVLNGLITDIITQITENFDISQEELTAVMDDLGLENFDLLDGEKLSQVVLGVANVDDAYALLTDETLYNDFQTVMTFADEALEAVSEELNIDPEKLRDMIGSQMTENSAVADDDVYLEEESKNVEYAETEDMMSSSFEGNELKTSSDESKNTSDKEMSKDEPGLGEKSAPKQAVGENQFVLNQSERGPEQILERAEVNETVWDENTQNIMDQIMDHMRAQVKDGLSTIDMQLHPASLGTLHIQLVSKDGNITASFVAQNETVKQALESQMIQLKESFAQQGVKVDAIEVMVQTHQFEENLDRNNRRDGREQYGRSQTRRIRLGEDILQDDYTDTDDEQIMADVMNINGNTVDYTA